MLLQFVTPNSYLVRGIWNGPRRPKRAIVWVHGLGSSAFSMLHVVEKLVDKNTAVLTFNNRGSGAVNRMSRKTKKKGKVEYGGAAHEVFTDCVDDISGAIRFVRKQGAKEIYLAGHSTGCQKSIYWAAKGGRGVKGIILLAPVSDYAAGLKRYGKKKVARATKYARALVARGKKHELLPLAVWPELLDAQRFLSLYTPDSVEEIFPYAQKGKIATLLQKIKVPILTLWAGIDEYSDRSAREVASWFGQNVSSKRSEVHVIPRTNHGFKGGEVVVARAIKKWIIAHK